MAENKPSQHYPLNAPAFKECLEREVYLSVHTWQEDPRIDLRQYRDGYPTPKGCILNASRWAVLRDHLHEIREEMTLVQGGKSDVDYQIHLGGNVYAAVKYPYAILDIRLRFMKDGALKHTTKGVTLRSEGFKKLNELACRIDVTIPRTTPCHVTHKEDDDEMAALNCKECSPDTYML